jgi:tripartite-type tricarboxylate transporter receptor subunit TctC
MKSLCSGWLIAVTGALAILAPAQAQYPDRPLRWILTQPPGGGNDILVRPIAHRLGEVLGQQIIVDNRAGAGGNVGTLAAAKSPPDGYTLVTLSISHAIAASLYRNLNYDLLRDFAPVTLLAVSPGVLAVHPSLPVKTVKEIITLAKARPGELTYSSSGNGTPNHLAAELFKYMTGVRLVHVPYKGGGNSMTGLSSGEVSLSFASLPSSIGLIRTGRLKALAVTTAQRSPSMPDLPTIGEVGVPGYEAETWFGLLVPAGTPKEAIARLHAGVVNVLKLPDVIRQLDHAGLQVRTSTPGQQAAFTREEVEKWAKIVKAANMRVD